MNTRCSTTFLAASLLLLLAGPFGCGGDSPQDESSADVGMDTTDAPPDTTVDAGDTTSESADASDAGDTNGDTATDTDDSEDGPPVVETDQGPVEGETNDETGVAQFLGVPYAKPPTGQRRFAAPEPPADRDETLTADTIPPACPQNYESIGGNTIPEISEDCLYLNVWSSDLSPEADADRPVMVWIHGGGLVQGSNGLRYRDDLLAYDGEDLAERGAVVVTINYRLGPFGFLAHPSLDDSSGGGTPPGNYGLRDQIRALRWVQNNIEAFGGNPDNVTVFGESAGAISICSLLAVDATQGLFDRAIMESGYCPTERQMRRLDTSTGELDSAFDQGQRYVDALGCDGADDVAACLRDASVQEILEARETDLGATAQGDVETFSPIIDEDLFDRPVRATITDGNGHDVPLLAGANADEWRLFTPSSMQNMSTEEYESQVQSTFPDSASEILGLYPAGDYDEPWHAWADIFTDSVFVCPTKAAAGLYASHGNDAYTYLFSHVRPLWANLGLGSFHGAEMSFVFHDERGSWRDTDRQLAEKMSTWWYQFARDGNPGSVEGTSWPKHTVSEDRTLELNGEGISTVEQLRREQCRFWADYSP